jgi:hypothetical protein
MLLQTTNIHLLYLLVIRSLCPFLFFESQELACDELMISHVR